MSRAMEAQLRAEKVNGEEWRRNVYQLGRWFKAHGHHDTARRCFLEVWRDAKRDARTAGVGQ